jgi:hypothetical protein
LMKLPFLGHSVVLSTFHQVSVRWQTFLSAQQCVCNFI